MVWWSSLLPNSKKLHELSLKSFCVDRILSVHEKVVLVNSKFNDSLRAEILYSVVLSL